MLYQYDEAICREENNVNWYWVQLHYCNDGYYTNDTWELVAAESEQQIREAFANPSVMAKARNIISLADAPIPRTPRKTKNIRFFNPERKQP